jgi:hypothetical protein
MLPFDVKVEGGIRLVGFLTPATDVAAITSCGITRPLFDFYAVSIE